MGDNMKFSWIRINKSKIEFVIVLALLGLISGILLYVNQSIEVKEGVISKVTELIKTISTTNQNNILYHVSLLSILIILSLVIIGTPIIMFYYFYEFASIGYVLAAFYQYKKINGILFGSIFIVVNKILFLAILTYFLISSIIYTKKLINNLKRPKNDIIINQLLKGFFILSIIFINDIILYFIGNKIISVFLFMV